MATEKNTQAVPEEQISMTDDTIKDTVSETAAAAEPAVEPISEEVIEIPTPEPAREEPAVEGVVPEAEEIQAEAESEAIAEATPEVVESEEAQQSAEVQVEEPLVAEEAEPEVAVTETAAPVAEETAEAETTQVEEPVSEESVSEESMTVAETVQAGTEETAVVEETVESAGETVPEESVEALESEQAEVPAEVAAEGKAPIQEPATEVKDGEPAEETVDFSDEEAQLDILAAEKPEFDLGEEDDSEIQHSQTVESLESFDPAGKTKAQLLDIFAVLLSEKPVQTIRREVEAIKVAFYKLLRAEHEELRRKFIEEGGAQEDFAPPVDNDEQRLKDLFGEYRKRRDEFISQLDRSKEENLRVKTKIIEDLKELVNSSETLGNTFNAFRELQQRWREAGPVPQANVKDLWETYNHHVENFYSYIKINKELRDLDLRKNYESKIALCEEAEALLLEPSVINSFHKLQKLHEQWRETGPVAREYKESLWDRFREASSRINKQHQEHFDSLKDEQKRNLELKTELCINTEQLTSGVLTTRKEWNKASDRLLEIQKVWKTIGFAPKKDNARIYERFRDACDKFFEQKRVFYQQVKTEMDHNLQLKKEICEAAEALQESEEWKKTTDELIALQKKWKEVGPVARRHSDAVWKRFRAACDRFFERKSQHFSSRDSDQENNLKLKQDLLKEISEADIQAGGFDMIKEFQRRWSEIGFVPIKQKDAIQKEYKAVMDTAFSILRGSGQSMRMDRFKDKVRNMKSSGDKRLRFERDRLYNKVKQLESEIALLENNIGFFSNSKNAEAMIRDVKDKIERTREEMNATIEKINLIDSQEEQ